MKMSCGDLQAYLDDTLEDSRRETFEDHMLGCASCQAGLEDSMQLLAAGAELARSPNRPRAASIREPARDSRRLLAWLGGGLAFAAAAAALVVWLVLPRERGPSLDERVTAALAPRRSLEARLPYEALDRHRPYDVDRGASRSEALSSALVAEVERARSLAAYAAVLLANRSFDQAAAVLDAAGQGGPPDDQLELARAVLALARDPASPAAPARASEQVSQALEHLDGILSRSPGYSGALWNRALALQHLQLPLAAAEAFDAVAKLGEPGWSAEAAETGAKLRANVKARAARWERAKQECGAMGEGGELPEPAMVRENAHTCRPDFYQAVRRATTSDALRALAPIAKELDADAGNTAAAELLRRVAAAPPARRAQAVAAYVRLTKSGVPEAERRALFEQLRASGQNDLVLGAAWRAGFLDELGDEYVRRAREAADPYYAEVAVEQSARLRIARGDLLGAEVELRAAVDACRVRDVELYCSYLYRALVNVYVDMHRPSDALETAGAGLARSRRLGLYWDERLFLDHMAKAERLARAHALMRAYVREATLRVTGDCEQLRYNHELLAMASIDDLRFEQARRDLAEAPDCGLPPTLERARVVAELARAGGSPEEARALGGALVRSREQWARSAGQRANFDAIEGRLLAARDPEAARPLLRRAIEAADGAGRGDADAAIARRDAYGALLVITAGAGDAAASLALLAEAAGTPPREGACVAGVMVDAERVLVVVRDARGALSQGFQPRGRTGPALDAGGLIPKPQKDALAGCARVDVLALAPVFGLPGLLPAELAWSYRGRPGAAPGARPAGAPVVVTVAEVTPPPELRLAPLALRRLAPIPGASHVELTGAEATPARVARELARADAIEIHAHGFVDQGISDAAVIALSPQGDGRFELDAREIAGLGLSRAPLVMLGACHAAYTAPYRHEPWGLPRAFLLAGARAVIASPAPIPDGEAGEVLRALGARSLAGTDPAAALRDERVRRLAADPKSWIGTVLLFD